MIKRRENIRFWIPILLQIVLALYSGWKLVTAHVRPNVERTKYVFERSVPAPRGSIYSAYGKESPFVRSVPFWEYRLDPVSLTNRVSLKKVKLRGEKPRTKEAILKTIADVLHLDYRTLLAKSRNTGNQYQYLTRSADPHAHRILSDSHLVAGVAITDCPIRQYLHKKGLCHVLGSVNAEYVGSAGLEQRYEKYLSGTPGKITGMKDAHGRELYDKRISEVRAIPGSEVYLTIDPNIQFETEAALHAGIREFGAAAGWSIVMDVKTGAVLAMASWPDFDPTAYGKVTDAARLNRAIGFTYEPGSVMKVITAASAIDAGFTTPNRLYNTRRDDPNYYHLPGDVGHVWEPYMSVKDAIVHSSNIVIGKLGYDFGAKNLWRYMRAFGFGEKTGIELPGEECGILSDPNKREWDKASRSRAAIGQSVAVTGIQLVGAYQAIANDGQRMKPYLVTRIEKPANVLGGQPVVQYVAQPKVLGQPISARASRTIREMMLEVASPKGTARRAAIKGYSVAGKTGTAQKAKNGRYLDGLFCASFCGIVPSGVEKAHPGDAQPAPARIVVLVSLDFEQRVKFHQGGNSSGPIFKRIAGAALRYLSVEPDRPDECVEEEE